MRPVSHLPCQPAPGTLPHGKRCSSLPRDPEELAYGEENCSPADRPGRTPRAEPRRELPAQADPSLRTG